MGMAPEIGGGLIQAGAQFGGMALQNSYNKKAEKRQADYNKEMTNFQQEKQYGLNIANAKLNKKVWDATNYEAQRKHMENAGLNVGLMYGMGGGQSGTMGSQSGSVSTGGVQTHAPDAQQAMTNVGMGMMNVAQIELLKAQRRNVDADTVNKQEGQPGITAESNTKGKQFEILEATYQEQIQKIKDNANIEQEHRKQEHVKTWVDQRTSDAKIEQEELKPLEQAVRIKAQQAEITLTEEEVKETTAKIYKIAQEIQRMKDMTDIQKEELLLKRMQTEFNTSTPAQIKQWTSIGTDILHATKGKNTTINKETKFDNRKSYDNSTTNFNE